MNPRPRTPLQFNRPFTRADALAAGITIAALRGWRERQEIIELAPGVFAPAAMAGDARLRSIWQNKDVAAGRKLVSIAGAAHIHRLWVPTTVAPALHQPNATSAVPERHVMRLGPLLVPDRAWTAVSLGRWQRLEGALIAADSALRLGDSMKILASIAEHMHQWPGSAALTQAIESADPLSGSALESWSRGIMLRNGLPRPRLQHPIEVGGQRLLPDFVWLNQRVIGEADGTDKYGTKGSEVYAEKRRQARLQGAGFTLYRWGWPEVKDDVNDWLRGLRRLIG